MNPFGQWGFDIAEDAHKTGRIDWDALMRLFPVLEELKNIEQNPEYHKEGNVFNHTKLAVEELIKDGRWQNSLMWERGKLFLAVLLHDIGKIDKTTQEDGKFTSKGHSASGARLVRQILWDYDNGNGFKVPFSVREFVASMVLLHMFPSHLLEKDDPLYSVSASSWTVNNRNLAILACADICGRICDNDKKQDPLAAVSLFVDFCQQHDCYIKHKNFHSDHSRFLYFFDRKGHPDIDRYHDCKGTVHMMSGLPGAGKDTYIKKNPDLNFLPVVGLDDIREEMDVEVKENEGGVSQLAKERCKEHMRKGEDFVFNATNFVKQTRARWIRLFNQYNYRIEIHYIEPDFTTLMKQNLGREKSVPEEVVRGMFKKLEPPTLLECHELHLVA